MFKSIATTLVDQIRTDIAIAANLETSARYQMSLPTHANIKMVNAVAKDVAESTKRAQQLRKRAHFYQRVVNTMYKIDTTVAKLVR